MPHQGNKTGPPDEAQCNKTGGKTEVGSGGATLSAGNSPSSRCSNRAVRSEEL